MAFPPSSNYEFVGFTGFDNGSVYPVFRQEYVTGGAPATPEEIDGYMQSLGFRKAGDAEYSNGMLAISDLRPRNVLKDEDGDLYVIDADFVQAEPQGAQTGNNAAGNIPQNGNIEPQNIPAPAETLQADGKTLQETLQVAGGQPSAFERIPKDEQGQPLYEQADPDMAWDALLEQTRGDEATAQEVANDMVADKEAALKKLEKQKPKGGTTPAEKIAARLEQKRIIELAKADLAQWQKIAQASQRRKQAALAEQERMAKEEARVRREQEERLRAEREEAERIRREALNGVPDFIDDTPQDARARGYRRVNGEKIDRQLPFMGLERNAALSTASNRFNEELLRYRNGKMDKNEMFHLGHPNGVMRMLLPDLPIIMRQRVVNKGSNRKHDVEISAMENMPQYISEPIFVFKKRDDTLGVLTEIHDRNGRNVFVAFDIASAIQDGGNYLEVNNVTTVHGRRPVNIIRGQ